jgi:heavy metal sensor kinase
MRLPIRWRLTLWNTVALAVVLLGLGGLVSVLLVQLHAHIDREIGERAERSLARVDQSLRAELQTLGSDRRIATQGRARLSYLIAEFLEHEKIYCVLYDTEGKVYERTKELAAQSIPHPPPPPAEPMFSEASIPIIRRQRILTSAVSLGGKKLTVLLMTPMEEVERDRAEVASERAEIGREFAQLGVILIASVPAALLVIGGLGYFLARKALAPVDQLHRLTEQITVDRLDRRLPIGNAGDELGRLAQTINAMIERLERSFAEIRRFTADASHELRTPLTAIRIETEVALKNNLEDTGYRHLLGSILEECERLTRLTDQLLALSREDSGKTCTVREPLDLNALVDGVLETMRPLGQAKGIAMNAAHDGPLQVNGDATRLRQVFYNLLDNAIKYTPEGGRIDVRTELRDQAATVVLHDTGIGIPPEHLPFVFDRFYRVDKARTRAEGGTGLGLSIAQSIARAHGGVIEMTSVPAQGTTCTVTLPAEVQPSRKEKQRCDG